MQNTFKVGDKVKVVKFTQSMPQRYHTFINREFLVVWAGGPNRGVEVKDPDSPCNVLFFYNDELELVKDEPAPQEIVSPSQVSQSQEVVSTPKKSIAWAVVNKATGKVEWIRQPRRVARKLAKFQNETSTHVYQVKKIEFNFV